MPVEDGDVTAGEAAALFGIDADLVHQWARRRKLTPVQRLPGRGRGGHGVPLYRLSEVARLVAERHARTRRIPGSGPPVGGTCQN